MSLMSSQQNFPREVPRHDPMFNAATLDSLLGTKRFNERADIRKVDNSVLVHIGFPKVEARLQDRNEWTDVREIDFTVLFYISKNELWYCRPAKHHVCFTGRAVAVRFGTRFKLACRLYLCQGFLRLLFRPSQQYGLVVQMGSICDSTNVDTFAPHRFNERVAMPDKAIVDAPR